MDKQEIESVEAYLNKLFQTDNIEIRQLPKNRNAGEVFLAETLIATLFRDEEDGELCYQFQMNIQEDEASGVESHLRKLLKRTNIGVRQLPKKEDTAEVYLGDEFIATLYKDNDKGKICHQFQMSILDIDLEDA